MDQNEITEEVTVTPVIKDIERLFVKGYRFLTGVITAIWQFVVQLIQLVFRHFIWFALVVFIFGALGFFSTQLVPRKYASEMILQLNVDSKEQLFNDVNHINALINNGQEEELKAIFKLSDKQAGSLMNCGIFPYSTYSEKSAALNELYQSTDTAVFNRLDIGALLSPDGIELSSKFRIVFTASDPTVFRQMEAPFLAYIERAPELQVMLETSRNNLIEKKTIYQKEMVQLDTLAAVYNKALIARAENGNASRGGNTTIEFGEGQNQREMNALDIQDRYLFYAQQVQTIDDLIAQYATCYFVKGHLNPVGNKIGYGPLARAILFALAGFVLLIILLLIKNPQAKKA